MPAPRALPALLLLIACEGPAKPQAQPPAPPPAATAPAPAAAATPAPPALPAGTTRVAKVAEIVESEKYSILRMDACGAEAWVAGPKTAGLSVGQTLEMPLGTPMADFEAKDLHRTFADILFLDWIRPAEKPLECPKKHSDADPGKGVQGDVTGVVLETIESGGYRYARLDVCGTETWVAGPKVPVKVGEFLIGAVSTEMTGFSSPTLGRRFEKILFLKQITLAPKAPDCSKKK